MPLFYYKNPIPTTDIIIEYQGGIVLIERRNPPYGFAIPGGFAEYGLSLEDNAIKEAKEETCLDIIIIKLLGIYSKPDRDPRGHMISVVYIAKGSGNLMSGDDAKAAKVYSNEEVRDLIKRNMLAFDHGRILEDYLNNHPTGLHI